MDSLLCGYLRFGKAPEKIIFVIDTEATTPGGVQTANPVHALAALNTVYATKNKIIVDWGDGSETVIPEGIKYSSEYLDDYAIHTYANPGKYTITVYADSFQ